MEAKNRNITWLQSTNQTEIMPRYQSLDSRERGKRRLIVAGVPERDLTSSRQGRSRPIVAHQRVEQVIEREISQGLGDAGPQDGGAIAAARSKEPRSPPGGTLPCFTIVSFVA